MILEYSKHWDDEENRRFYERLKALTPAERSKVLIGQARALVDEGGGNNEDLLKAAESLMTFWTLNLRREEDRTEAHQLLFEIYTLLGEPEKARAFQS